MKVSRPAEKPSLFDDDFISHLSSTQKLKLEASKLEIQWKKICDQEKRSKQRNRELLKDFERVEQHAAVLAVKTERLKTYKQQYENYINKMYPRWREDLENYRLGQQQSRNGSTRNATTVPLLHPSSSSRAAMLEPRNISNSQLSSTQVHPPRSVPFDRGAVYDRSPPETRFTGDLYSSQIQSPYDEFSYHERHSNFPHIHDGDLPRSQYSQQVDSQWQSPRFYDSHRQFDSMEKQYQSQFALTSREPGNFLQRSSNPYLASSGGQFYARQQPSGEISRNFSPDTRYVQPGLLCGQPQGLRPAAPYEPRTELQRSYLGGGVHQGPYDHSGLGRHYYDGQPSGYYGDDRLARQDPPSMQRGASGRGDALVDEKFINELPTRPVMATGHEASQGTRLLFPANQPFVSPEKPLEGNIPTSSFPEALLSSTVIESTAEGSDARHDEIQEGVSFTPSSSEHSPPEATVNNIKAEKPEEEDVLKRQSLTSEETKTAVKDRALEVERDESPKMLVTIVKTGQIAEFQGQREGLGNEPEDASTGDINDEELVQPPAAHKQSSEIKEAELSDEDESLDLSDLSLPDGNENYVPSALQKTDRHDSMQHGEEAKLKNAVQEEEILTGPSASAVVPDTTKSITEDISEDIPESVALEDSEDHKELPVLDQGDRRLSSSLDDSSKQPPKMTSLGSGENERKSVSNEVLHQVDREKEARESLPHEEVEESVTKKVEESKEPAVGLDGFLALLQAVDADVEVSFSPEALYRSPQCSSDMRQEITRAAEVGSSLQSFDPNTISMIVLEELPLLVSSSLAGCLIPDRVFSEGVPCKSEKELRQHVESSLIKLWKSLFSHLFNIVSNNVMKAEEVGDVFGSLLISQHSKYRNESHLLLCQVLEDAISGRSDSPIQDDDLDFEPRFQGEVPYKDDASVASEASSSTLGSTPPKVQPVKPNEEERKPTPDPTASYEDDFEDDVPLTETAAYLKMVSSTHSEPDGDISDILGNSGPQKQESEADDDVERELARSISPPVTSPRTRSPSHSKSGKPKPKLSLFDTDVATTQEKDSKELGNSWGGSSAKSVKSDISDSDSVISPPLSPHGGFGYVPTAMETTDQQPTKLKEDRDNERSEPKSANDSKAKRKTDFWNNSDTESELDLQLSTGGFDQDDDDFDFYG